MEMKVKEDSSNTCIECTSDIRKEINIYSQ